MQIPNSINEAKKMFAEGTLSPTQLVKHYLTIIEEKNPTINAVLETFESALVDAKVSDEKYKSKNARPLEGMPVLIKDNILYKDHKSSAASKMLATYVAPYDSTVVKLLRENGAIILGRTNMDEFALGSSGENSAFGKTLNPINTERVPGGTSSGSAAAVASGMCLFALGTDTGGSVRMPANFCGVYGLKPTFGYLSRNGLIAAVSSFDVPGVLANTVDDVELVEKILAKEDIMDNTTIPEKVREEIKSKNNYKKVVVYPEEYVNTPGVSEEVKANFNQSLDKIKSAGYEVRPVRMETLKYALSIYYIINTAEVSTNLSRMEGLRFGGGDIGEAKNYQELFAKNRGKFFGPEVKRRIMLGSYVLSHGYYDAYYGKALSLQNKMKQEFAKIFEEASIFVMPTSPTTAFTFDGVRDPLSLYLEDIFTVSANITSIPAMSIPTGFDKDGLPFSLQIHAPYACDDFLFKFTKDFLQK
jgi:aspartyl-tRNA(Asn)/glutamyl-tRNA(Gln) amidotransferase subunit A